MKLFASLYRSLLSTSDSIEKSNLIAFYLDQLNEPEKITAIKLLLNGKAGALISSKSMTKMVMQRMNLSENLIKECHKACQDWVETCSLIVANPGIETSNYSLSEILTEIGLHKSDSIDFCIEKWKSLSTIETWLFNKLITGTLRPLISLSQFSKIMATKWNVDQELVHLRITLYDLDKLTFKHLIEAKRNMEELNFLPYTFVRPNESYINLSLENHDEYTVERFIYGKRLLLIKSEHKLIAYTIDGEWIQPDPANWHQYIPDKSQLEIIISEDKAWIVQIPIWSGSKVQSMIINEWVNKFGISGQVNWLPKMEFKDWTSIHLHGDIIIKHNDDNTKWYRIKPKSHELIAVLWYAEMPVTSNSMIMKLSFAIHTENMELITICQITSDEMPETDQTRLYYWIQNNTMQKFGPVRTVRATQYFIISYDRVRIYKRSKLGYQLVNARIFEWLKDKTSFELSKSTNIKTQVS